MVKGVGFPTGEELPDMKASEYAEGEDWRNPIHLY
jgi:hypothetical protein